MTRFVFAAVLVAALGPLVGAQPVPGVPVVPPPPPPPALYEPNVYVPPGTPPGPAIPFFKTGGVVVGAYGFYPFDTGNWLLGGTDGLTRQSGSFTMVFPGVPAAPEALPTSRSPLLCKRGLLRR